jgi:hypothetical protein
LKAISGAQENFAQWGEAILKSTFIRYFQEDNQQKSSLTVASVPKLWCRLSETDIYPLNFGVD